MDDYSLMADDEAQQQKSARASQPDDVYASMAADEATQRHAALSASLRQAVPVNPDKAAKLNTIAQATGVPVDVVGRNEEELAAQAKVKQLQSAISASPFLARQMSDPEFAKLAHDDVPNLTAAQQAMKALTPASDAVQPGQQYFEALPDRAPTLREQLNDWWASKFGGLTAAQKEQQRGAAEAVAILAARKADPALVPAAGATPAQIKALNDQAWEQSRQAIGGMSQVLDVGVERAVKSATFGIVSPLQPTESHSWEASTAGAVGQLAGFIGGPAKAAHAAMGLIPGAAKLAPVAGEAFTTALAKNVLQQGATLGLASGLEDTGAALLDTHSVDEGLAKLGNSVKSGTLTGALFGAAGKLLPDNTIAQWLGRALGVSAAQDAKDGTTPWDDRPLEDKLFNYGLNAFFTAKGAGRTQGGWFTSNPEVVALHADAVRADQSQQNLAMLQALSEAAGTSKLRERDPEAFKSYVKNASEEGRTVSGVYVDGQTLADTFNQAGVKADDLQATMPEVARQMDQAIQIKGDVRIPIEDYATHIAGGPLDATLLPHLKTDPAGMTYQQGEEFYKTHAEGMKSDVEKILTQRAFDVAHQESGDAVEHELLGQLNAANRFSPDVNAVNAKLAGAFYRTQSARLGITPEEMYVRYPLNLTSETFGGGRTMDQPARGQISFGDDITQQPSVISLLHNADLSTFSHELGHFQLEVLSHMADQPDAPAAIKGDMDTLLNWFGVKDKAAWNSMSLEEKRPMHEQLARGFEAYLFEGKAPSVELQGIFSRMRAWMINVYRSLAALNVNLSPEVRGVFDRLLASNDEIIDAEAQRGQRPQYKTAEEAGATPEEWKSYLEQQQDQTQEAVDELQSRALRDMQWLSNAKSKLLKTMQRDATTKRKAIEGEVTAEVDKQPVYAAQRFLKTGEMVSDKGEAIKVDKGAKLDNAALKEMYPETMLNRPDLSKLQGMTRTDGLHPDLVAQMFGYTSGDQLVREMTSAEPKASVIEGMTDQRMLERYGDLNSPDAIERAANQALSNDAHLKMLATEMRFADRAAGSRGVLVKAAKEFAAEIIARKKLSEIKPAQFQAAERKALQDAEKAHLAGDRMGVAEAKRAQLVNAHATKLAYAAQEEIRKGTTYQAKFDKDSIRNKIDVDIRDQIDDLRDRFDFRKIPTDAPTRAELNLTEWIQSQIDAGLAPLVNADMINPTVRMHYADMSMEQFRGYVDTLKSLEHIGRERQAITINGEKQDLSEYVKTQLVPKLQERGARFSKDQLLDRPEDRHTNPIAIALDHFNSWRRSAAAQLKPQEFKRNQYDRHELLGPFGESLFDPVINANYRKVRMLKGLSDDFTATAKELGRDWQNSLREAVTNDKLLDPDKSTPEHPVYMNFTRGKMIGLAIHVGNESNFDKAAKGWGWKPDAVWRFLHENMSAKDWQSVQSVWDLYDKHWPEMEAMNRRLGNTSPDRIEPRPFPTQFGEMRGGYAAISYDSLRSRRGEKEASGEAINPGAGLFGRNYFRSDTTTNGSLNKRIDSYVDRVDLDFHGIARKLNETIHDLAYREALIDANKIIEHAEFRREFKTAYGPEAYKSMRDWIGQLANSNNFDRSVGAMGKFMQYTRTGMVINAIGFRASTVLKHGGSAAIKTMGYFAGGGEKYLASRFAAIGTNYTAEIQGAMTKFGEIQNRLLQQDRDFKAASTSMFEPESVQAKAERFGHAAVAWSDMMTAVPTAWAAYDRAVTEGIPVSQGGTGQPMTEAQAVNYANKIVREAHGTTAEAGRSLLLSNQSEGVKLFTTLYGFMNNSYGQQLDAFDKLRTNGISNAPVLARTFMAIIVPALWAGYLTHGGKKDDEGWAAWVGKAILGEVAASVPLMRDAYSMAEGYSHAGMVATESWFANIVLAGKDILHMAQGDSSKGSPAKDILNTIGTSLHIPGMGQLGTSIQYLANVKSGKEAPQNALEFAKGVALGHGTKH